MTPTAATAAELPIAGYTDLGALAKNGEDGYPYEYLTPVPTTKRCTALTPQSPAQAQLDALREEVARLKAEFTENAELMHRQYVEQSLQVARLTKERDEARSERDIEAAARSVLKAQPTDVDALVALADAYALARIEYLAGGRDFRDTAREALRAAERASVAREAQKSRQQQCEHGARSTEMCSICSRIAWCGDIAGEATLRRAVSVMEDVLGDIADWEDNALAEAVEASKRDLQSMVEAIELRGQDTPSKAAAAPLGDEPKANWTHPIGLTLATPTAQVPAKASGHYLWEHDTEPPRVARPEDATFARGEPRWVRGYPVEVWGAPPSPTPQPQAEAAESFRQAVSVLRVIAEQDPIENVLDPQWAARIAKSALDALASTQPAPQEKKQ